MMQCFPPHQEILICLLCVESSIMLSNVFKDWTTVSSHLTIDFMDDAKYPHAPECDGGYFLSRCWWVFFTSLHFTSLHFYVFFLFSLGTWLLCSCYCCMWTFSKIFAYVLYFIWCVTFVCGSYVFSMFLLFKVVNFVKTFPQFNSQTHYTINTINTMLLTNIFNINE